MRILLDTNVWRYLADANAGPALQRVARRRGADIVLAPSTAYETLRMQDTGMRRKIISLMINPVWVRLMPEAFSECAELMQEIRRCRPEWIKNSPDLSMYRRFRYDWIRKHGGFWSRFSSMPEMELLAINDGDTLELARAEAYRMREYALKESAKAGATKLTAIIGRPGNKVPGWRSDDIELWRLAAMVWTRSVFLKHVFHGERHAYLDWLSGELDVPAMMSDMASFNQFWLYDADPMRLPRFWLRGAFEFLQQWHKVTDGTPGDSQLASYLQEADLIVSADKNFVRFTKRCFQEAPMKIADGVLIAGGQQGVEELISLVETC